MPVGKEMPKTHERIGERLALSMRACSPEADDRIGVEPDRDARQRARNPARGKAQGRIDVAAKGKPGHRTADGSEAQKSTPFSSPIDRLFKFTCPQPAAGHPDENQSGRTSRHKRHVGPVGQKCR